VVEFLPRNLGPESKEIKTEKNKKKELQTFPNVMKHSNVLIKDTQ
jgi:hypothetical protein